VTAALFTLLLSAATTARAQALYDAPTRLTIKSEVLGEERVILVRTPPGYEHGDARFPVLYMTDGDAHLLHTSGTIGFLARNGRMPEMIVVGITNTDRTRDLTPTRSNLKTPEGELQAPTSGGGDKFLKFIQTELIPRIEKQYRVEPYRVLAGHSLGGLFALHAMVSRPELFNAYIAVSPSTQWDDFYIVKRVEAFLKARKSLNRTLFVSLGNEPGNIGVGFEKLKAVLAGQQVKDFMWDSAHLEDEDHGSVVLRSHYAGLRKVFDGWQLPRDPGTGRFAGGLQELDEHYKKLSARLGYPIVAPEPLVNVFGYQLMTSGKVQDAIAVFKLNVERYPRSANVYDSLAEAYERAGQLDLAQTLSAKAVAVARETADPNLNALQQRHDHFAGLLKKPATGSH
jgi:hypothetical protein